ncbi:L,D-transpeptidase [Streptomyces sp. NPDC007264]|uniref:L,D-transpeptidase n=1 Tax=Streptomyces sp. NPDC007264 TaxID=3364777 RepID=UPI0036DFA217
MSDDLITRLRELAESGQTPPSASGTEIRRRADARRRRHRAVATVAGAFAVTVLGLVLLRNPTGADAHDSPSPATGLTGTATTGATPTATVDPTRRVLVVGRRELPVVAVGLHTPAPTGRMTVTAREDTRVLPAEEVGLEHAHSLEVPWVVELRAEDGTITYLGAPAHGIGHPGRFEPANGWFGLRPADARWLYEQVRVGDVVDVESRRSTSTTSPAGRTSATAGSASTAYVSGGPGTGSPHPS